MKWTAYSIKRGDPKYKEEAENPRKQKEEHTPGWPHHDLKGNCICLCKSCMGPSGCICRSCAGIGHINCPAARRLAAEHDKVRI